MASTTPPSGSIPRAASRGVVMMQFLPFADTKALGMYDTFERGVYQLADASVRLASVHEEALGEAMTVACTGGKISVREVQRQLERLSGPGSAISLSGAVESGALTGLRVR